MDERSGGGGGGYTDTVKEREGKEIDRDRQRAIGWREGQEEKERGGGGDIKRKR